MKAGSTHDTATPAVLAEAAGIILEGCVQGLGNQGGVAGNLGNHGDLAVRIVLTKSNVHCADSPGRRGPPSGTCRGVLDYMPATYDHQKFGRRGEDGVVVVLPRSFMKGQSCLLQFAPKL